MEALSNGVLVTVLQNLQLALDYQHQQLDQGSPGWDDPADFEDYLVQVARVLGEFEAEYERRVAKGAALGPLRDLPRIPLSPPTA